MCHAWLLHRDKPTGEVERGPAFQKLLLGVGGNVQARRRNWRQALLEVLDGWLCMFSEVASKNKGRLSFGSATHAQPSAVSLDDL